MKKRIISWIITALSLLTNIFILGATYQKAKDKDIIQSVTQSPSQPNDWDTFISALAWIESSWDDNAVSHKQAVGYLQLTPILIEDANRIVGQQTFSLESRTDRQESIRIFNVIMDEYNPEHDMQLALKIWNPYSNVSYHRAVMKKYRELKSQTI